ncbi:hypothetical protein QCA50_000395 [Cerrena zonata]|uniref:RNA methyltransferase n=1 Tax=Cerrena zonata TaxID=2478898 RepID=A0AAW0GQ75_9APHY
MYVTASMTERLELLRLELKLPRGQYKYVRSTDVASGPNTRYYSKRPFVHDPRLALLPRTLFHNARVLDVGCNEGWVTCEIAQSWGARKVIGVDIDETLIRAAWKRRRTVWSQTCPSGEASSNSQSPPSEPHSSPPKKRRRINDVEETDGPSTSSLTDYFPASCEHMFGPLPIPPSDEHTSSQFPHNAVFQAADWVTTEVAHDAEGYDVVIAFSISKWIHLNGGDEGIRTFFKRVHKVLSLGGTFILEPQEWNTYAKAKRMDPRLKENAQNLKLKPDDFEGILVELGFGPAEHLGITGEGGFRRPVDLYRKIR